MQLFFTVVTNKFRAEEVISKDLRVLHIFKKVS